jgi:hypothetical protein
MPEKEEKLTSLERQQQKEIKELKLIVKALEASNNLLTFRLEEVMSQNKELTVKVLDLEKPKK